MKNNRHCYRHTGKWALSPIIKLNKIPAFDVHYHHATEYPISQVLVDREIEKEQN